MKNVEPGRVRLYFFFLCPLDPGFPLSCILFLREYPCRLLVGVAMAVGIVEWGRVRFPGSDSSSICV